MLVRNIAVRAELEVVVGDQSDNVGEKIAALEGKILENEVQCIIGILNTRNWKVSNLFFFEKVYVGVKSICIPCPLPSAQSHYGYPTTILT